MRISDWSSDVCSSDLIGGNTADQRIAAVIVQIVQRDLGAVVEPVGEIVEAKAILALIMRCAEVLARHVDRPRRLRAQPGPSGGPDFTIRLLLVIAEAQTCIVADRNSFY